MIPVKDKKYMIYCQGPYDYNKYEGHRLKNKVKKRRRNYEIN